MVEINIKLMHAKAVVPRYAKVGDAGLDLTAVSIDVCSETGNITYGTGVSIEIPDGYVGLLFPRSSISKNDLTLTNSVGVIDSGYRGEIMFKFKYGNSYKTSLATLFSLADCDYLHKNDCEEILCEISKESVEFKQYEVGDRIGQLLIIPYPKVEFNVVSELSDSERGSGNYGSTGK